MEGESGGKGRREERREGGGRGEGREGGLGCSYPALSHSKTQVKGQAFDGMRLARVYMVYIHVCHCVLYYMRNYTCL